GGRRCNDERVALCYFGHSRSELLGEVILKARIFAGDDLLSPVLGELRRCFCNAGAKNQYVERSAESGHCLLGEGDSGESSIFEVLPLTEFCDNKYVWHFPSFSFLPQRTRASFFSLSTSSVTSLTMTPA